MKRCRAKLSEFTKTVQEKERVFKQKLQLVEGKIVTINGRDKKNTKLVEQLKAKKALLEKSQDLQRQRADDLDARLQKQTQECSQLALQNAA